MHTVYARHTKEFFMKTKRLFLFGLSAFLLALSLGLAGCGTYGGGYSGSSYSSTPRSLDGTSWEAVNPGVTETIYFDSSTWRTESPDGLSRPPQSGTYYYTYYTIGYGDVELVRYNGERMFGTVDGNMLSVPLLGSYTRQ
jgi:hypothetical protein